MDLTECGSKKIELGQFCSLLTFILEINKLINSRTSHNSNHTFFNSNGDNSTINKILENKYEIFNFES